MARQTNNHRRPTMATKTKMTKAKTTKTRSAKKATTTTTRSQKTSQLDAAVQVLTRSKKPMNCKELVDAMAKRKLWSSPNGKTPHATLYAAILREINTKGKDARFKKVDRGQFALAGKK